MPKQIPDLPNAASPIGPYSVAAEANGFVYISGQIPVDPATGVGVEGDAAAQAKRVMENIALLLGDLGLGFTDVVKTTIFLTDMGDFAKVNAVYAERFPEDPPARSTVEVSALPGGYNVEIETIATR
ncbi:MAG: reactive intermediate/imine deaminase [Actinobacteria bacterium]|uniref:RidA/YER057c/UK114 superfamily protein n=1 Tax=hydrothermal vent metagenome TaxID=652676 RepID=A0A3B0SSN8_9ZZZZ|nr:reactive intermediate/imine deaminase [Actinomycetota bacterium]